jgi:hypothetical protein
LISKIGVLDPAVSEAVTDSREHKLEVDDIWNFEKSTSIEICKDRRRIVLKTLDEAKKRCIEDRDCKGVTESNRKFELRCGPAVNNENLESNSWIQW